MQNEDIPRRIAIIGSGISGLTSAYLLARRHQVTLFEANDYLGGHTATVDVPIDGKNVAVDTGFIVFNDRTYPNFIELMQRTNVEIQATEMSFSVHNQATGLEYNGHSVSTLFAQRRNIFNLQFYRFIREILKFNALAKQCAQEGVDQQLATLGEFLDKHEFSDYFADHYILPMVAAIWSASINSCREFPFSFFLRFFNNHGLLDIRNRPQWYVIKGGSRSYIPALTEALTDIRLSTPVQSVRRIDGKVEITSDEQGTGSSVALFDDVIFACHSDQALHLLSDATAAEQNILGRMAYCKNEVVLHTDDKMLPKAKKALASWNYWLDSNSSDLPSVTYSMNILQGLDTESAVCVTLNRTADIAPEKILRQFTYAHPVFTSDSIAAQKQRSEICGQQHTHFCGAYWANGFHEDGVKSALDICLRFDESIAREPRPQASGEL
ncbi:MAG: putative NAD/FAD-binding protein [Halioglobus sp.]|jgi:predicted NAD/FAD-binding protein